VLDEEASMASAPPTRVDDGIYADAAAAGTHMGRSAARQLSHWARIGREVEATTVMATRRRRIDAVLAGRDDYDLLDADDQALVRSRWAERIGEHAATVDVGAAKHAAGLPYLTVDDTGTVIKVHPDGTTEQV
jgi:hypothetical protein